MMKRILLVDNDIKIQRLLMEELEEDGYKISTASNGKDALSLLAKEFTRPDLVIMDLRMPVMSGLETIGYMLKLKFNVPVIIFSAYSGYRNDPLAMAADAYVVKSFDLSELKARIHALV
jgi:DNA-binding response OmpR family regulator